MQSFNRRKRKAHGSETSFKSVRIIQPFGKNMMFYPRLLFLLMLRHLQYGSVKVTGRSCIAFKCRLDEFGQNHIAFGQLDKSRIFDDFKPVLSVARFFIQYNRNR